MANPVGEDSWLAYIEEETRHARDLEGRVRIVELFKRAVSAEPGSLKIWLAYCEYFWSLFTDCQSVEAGWSDEEQQLGRELFPFSAALSLWSEGYEALKYRLNDSHKFWNRWISIEQEQLARTRSPVGIERITYLFRNRLKVPHADWDNTSQLFSSFLSSYNNVSYESEFRDITALAAPAKEAYDERERRELELNKQAQVGDQEKYKTAMKAYLDWEIMQTASPRSKPKDPVLAVSLALALFSRALTGVFAFDENIWRNYVVYLSSLKDSPKMSQAHYVLPDFLNVLQRATSHCPSSGTLWSRYILSAEEAGWPFHDIESIKHAATNAKALDKEGMTGVIDMYAAWCGYLKRTALNPNAPDDAVDIADVGLTAALEDVQLWGERLYSKDYQGDPTYRLERILVQYLTEKKGEIDEARKIWKGMAEKPLLGNSYDFWVNYYLWEMVVYSSQPKQRSPTPATPANGTKPVRAPSLATDVLLKALSQKTLDWPERIMEVCNQHCNDYEEPSVLRRALDIIHKTRRRVEKRRAHERAQAESAYAAQAQVNQGAEDTVVPDVTSNSKRKRAETMEEASDAVTKRPKNTEVNGTGASVADEQSLKRDRENTSVMVQNLPADATQTALKKYFKDYGTILNLTVEKERDGTSSSALIEFESPEEMRSALLRDQKYFNESQITVEAGVGLTIYVTNYPPTADEAYIRGIFTGCGDIFSIRFPSLKFNTHRRFCYISFRDADSAAKATKLDGKQLEGSYKLVAKYSNPAGKKKREGALAEGRELCVKNLDFKLTQDELRDVFSKYGTVESTNILKNLKGQNRGTAFVVMETKEQAERAIELDKTKLGYKVIQVELSKDKNYKPIAFNRATSASASPSSNMDIDTTKTTDENNAAANALAPSGEEIRARTMAVMDLPDTVNDARVRLLAEKYGDIVKIVLRPDHQGAIIEFTNVTTVGKAMMALNGFEIVPGKKLRAGTVDELLKERPETRGSRLMAPPQAIRRPVLGGQKPKPRAGFAAPKLADGHGTKGDASGTEASAKPKSNADFKAMFLGKTQ